MNNRFYLHMQTSTFVENQINFALVYSPITGGGAVDASARIHENCFSKVRQIIKGTQYI